LRLLQHKRQVFLPILIFSMQWKQHHEAQRALAAASAKGDEREIVLSRLGDNLPSWVVFPDVERAEWLNRMIKYDRITYLHIVALFDCIQLINDLSTD